jgi:hypothetical protein
MAATLMKRKSQNLQLLAARGKFPLACHQVCVWREKIMRVEVPKQHARALDALCACG